MLFKGDNALFANCFKIEETVVKAANRLGNDKLKVVMKTFFERRNRIRAMKTKTKHLVILK